jgi:uncharacterized protein YbjT (DUF2867 family)
MAAPAVIIFGATSGGGRELARLLRKDQRNVCAVVRQSGDTADLTALGVETRIADAFDAEALDKALSDIGRQAAVVSFLGGGFAEGHPVDGTGNINAINAAVDSGAGRFILMTSVGCGDSYDAAPDLSKQFWTDLWKEKNRGEEHLRKSSLAWTIIRPGGLRAPEPTGHGILVEDPMVTGLLHRDDLAALTYAVLDSEKTIRKTYTAVDRHQSQHANDGEILAAISQPR